jgi:hypothetical protein
MKQTILFISLFALLVIFTSNASAVVYTGYHADYRSLRTTGYTLTTPTGPFSYYMGSNGVYAGGSYPHYYVGSNREASYHRMQVLTTRNTRPDSRYTRYNQGIQRQQQTYQPNYRVVSYQQNDYGTWKAYWKPHQQYQLP